ncbi:uncharacterized protein BYT42DRAFT_491496 [Radiomyces spectabilis]|uniref:uncharacterized protein n=1 Tax=Radiomyces spectabilis TaxID=64574 RepID=UPI002220646F|nr:uncharacterized protein BYT42DRAFT_491496 [Radiomyces spectabilis]KAI8388219.1 hypothetical protein BYT42DRAFT_491496 [Radiomyces spectabilis]
MVTNGKLYKIVNARVLINHAIVEDSYVWFQDGKIVDGFSAFFAQGREPDEIIDAHNMILAPGFLDVQINGSYGIDFADHDKPSDQLQADIDTVAKGLLQDARPGDAELGSEILGAHVEGPFISEEKKGAHDPAIIQSAKGGIAAFDKAYGPELKHGGKTVCIMTLAPELEGVLDVIPDLVKRGITVSIGHSAASVEQAEAGVRKGATFMTHLFNAMMPFHHRDPAMIGILGATDLPPPAQPERHPLPSLTAPDRTKPDPRPFYGIICDGIHVHPNSVRIAYYSHPKGCVLVTDALSAAGLPPGSYQLGGRDVEVRHGGAYIKGTDTLAGSTVTIDACVRNFRRFTRCSVVEALEAATLHPAQMLGIKDRKGTLNPGADADIVFLDDDLHVKRVFVRGQEVQLAKNAK